MTTETFTPENREEWRTWLKRNHSRKESIWLVYYKKSAEKSTVTYSEAVDEQIRQVKYSAVAGSCEKTEHA